MAITPCAPCECIVGNIPNDVFKQNILLVLCDILAALGGGGTIVGATPLSAVQIAHGAITNAYLPTGLADGEAKLRQGYIANNTNGDLMFSFNGVDDHVFVAAQSTRALDFGNLTLTLDTDVYVKFITDPNSGTLTLDGSY